ncbi:MAG: hypothetical protein P8013_05410 [Candidatus Sulfobium sp.]|jgi:hypothetical protein
MKDNIKAFIIGFIVIAVLSWLALLTMDALETAYIGLLAWASPVIGAFITAIMAKSRKLALAFLLALPSAIIFGIENYLWQLLGRGSDFPGFKGFVTLVCLEFIIAIILCGIGGLAGTFIAKRKFKTSSEN